MVYFVTTDDKNVLSSLPTPKLIIPKTHKVINRIKSNPAQNKFVKNEPEEVIIKRHIQGKDLPYTFPFFKSTKSTSTSTIEQKRKLPVVELASYSDSDNLNEYLQYFDELEKKPFPFFNGIKKTHESKDILQNFENWYKQNNHSKHSKDKVLDLRSLPSKSCQSCEQCVCPNMKKSGKVPTISNVHDCTRRPDTISTFNFYPPYPQPPTIRQVPPGPKDVSINFPMGIGVPMGIPFGMPAGYPGGIPVGVPANVPIAYAPGVAQTCCQQNYFKEVATHNKPCRHSNDHLYYNDDDESVKIYRDSNDDYNKRKRKHKGELFVNIDYDVEETKKPNQNPLGRNNPNTLAKDIFKDLNQSYTNTIMKKCFCCSSTISDINNFLLSILVIILFSNTLMLH
ncbi:unnamed protein product [Spodoptera littoralis]|uniref:Uncharacterized protein n=1 Tax=Spodoptera littoralis TaxID=7109 RepID=A0A9P0ILA4_SPOLI|nr:unnamed protein product [Spodoptera littoralis]CAH1647078.1 unnamed protein product [Spodoptera littoralis]